MCVSAIKKDLITQTFWSCEHIMVPRTQIPETAISLLCTYVAKSTAVVTVVTVTLHVNLVLSTENY